LDKGLGPMPARLLICAVRVSMRLRCIGVLSSLGVGVAGMVLSACGSSSTAPKPTATQQMAASLDTQAVAAASAGQFDRFRLLAYPIAAMSQNLTPASVSLLVDGAPEPYQALALDVIGTTAGPNPVPTDSFAVVVVWTGADVSELVYGQLAFYAPSPDTLEDWADLSDTVANTNLNITTSVLTVTVDSAKAGCKSYSLPDLNAAVVSLLQGSKCNSGSATVGLSFNFIPNPPNNPHASFVMASQTIPLLRIVPPAQNGGQDRLRQLLSRGSRHRAP
jgi:hypothetical protein